MIAEDYRTILLVMTDGRRDCIKRTLASASEHLAAERFTRRVIFDDSGDDQYHEWLSLHFPRYEVVSHPAGRQGFGGAIRAAWSYIGVGPEPALHQNPGSAGS